MLTVLADSLFTATGRRPVEPRPHERRIAQQRAENQHWVRKEPAPSKWSPFTGMW